MSTVITFDLVSPHLDAQFNRVGNVDLTSTPEFLSEEFARFLLKEYVEFTEVDPEAFFNHNEVSDIIDRFRRQRDDAVSLHTFEDIVEDNDHMDLEEFIRDEWFDEITAHNINDILAAAVSHYLAENWTRMLAAAVKDATGQDPRDPWQQLAFAA